MQEQWKLELKTGSNSESLSTGYTTLNELLRQFSCVLSLRNGIDDQRLPSTGIASSGSMAASKLAVCIMCKLMTIPLVNETKPYR